MNTEQTNETAAQGQNVRTSEYIDGEREPGLQTYIRNAKSAQWTDVPISESSPMDNQSSMFPTEPTTELQ